jgi:hypothetical protein
MTHKDGWKFNRDNMMKKCACGRKKYDAMVRRLKQFGYLKIDRQRLENGQFGDYVWELNYTPEPVSQNATCGETPTVASADVGKGNHLSVTNSKNKKPIGKPIVKKSTRQTQMPKDWEPPPLSPTMQSKIQNLTLEEIDHEAHQFRNHHTAKASKYVDWDAAWRTWIGNAAKWKKPERGKRYQPASQKRADARREGIEAAFCALEQAGFE